MVGKIKEANEPAFGFDAFRGDYGDLVARGIIDPAKVVRVAVENACSVAGALITTQVAIADRDAEGEHAAYPTLRLVRWRIGDWCVSGLAPGEWREIHVESPTTGPRRRGGCVSGSDRR